MNARVKAHADHTVADAMDLALLTGQRPADVLKNKTGARLGIEITEELAELLDRINADSRMQSAPFLIHGAAPTVDASISIR
jgi:hypothetical protein